jgi:hypothetical protein
MLGRDALLARRASKRVQEEGFVSLRLSIHTFHYQNMTLGQKISLQRLYFGLFIFRPRRVQI